MKTVIRCLFIALLFTAPLSAIDVQVKTFDEELFTLDIEPEDNVLELKKQVETLFGYPSDQIRLYYDGQEMRNEEHPGEYTENSIWVEFVDIESDEEASLFIKSPNRSYWSPLTSNEKKDIGYIVKTLAYKSLSKIWKYKGSLEYAGDRVNHVHPLNFLHCIFSDEELKIGLRVIRKRGWVWGDFYGGIKKGFSEETAKENVKTEHVQDFANKLGIDANLILPLIQGHHWKEVVDALIEALPRQGDPNHYDM